MPTPVACPKCKTKYSLPDSMVGKPVKCQKCGAKFQKGKPQTAGAAATGTAKARPAGADAASLKQMGLGAPIQQSNELFGAAPADPRQGDPLANHVIQDPGFGQATTEVPKEETPDEYADIFANPELASKKKKKRKKDALSGYDLSEDKPRLQIFTEIWFYVAIVLALCAAVTLILKFSTYTVGPKAAFINAIIAAVVLLGVGVWALILMIKKSKNLKKSIYAGIAALIGVAVAGLLYWLCEGFIAYNVWFGAKEAASLLLMW